MKQAFRCLTQSSLSNTFHKHMQRALAALRNPPHSIPLFIVHLAFPWSPSAVHLHRQVSHHRFRTKPKLQEQVPSAFPVWEGSYRDLGDEPHRDDADRLPKPSGTLESILRPICRRARIWCWPRKASSLKYFEPGLSKQLIPIDGRQDLKSQNRKDTPMFQINDRTVPKLHASFGNFDADSSPSRSGGRGRSSSYLVKTGI